MKETELFYTDSETGNPLIFIHGLGGTHYMFEPQVQEFGKRYRVICQDWSKIYEESNVIMDDISTACSLARTTFYEYYSNPGAGREIKYERDLGLILS